MCTLSHIASGYGSVKFYLTSQKNLDTVRTSLTQKVEEMANVKVSVNQDLVKAFEAAKPKNPALTSADKVFLRGLHRRGFTMPEIQEIAQKAGFVVPANLFETKKKSKT